MNGEGTHFRYTQKQIDQMEAAARKHFQKIEKAVDYFKSRDVAPEVMLLKLRKDDWLHFALLNYTAEIVGKRVVVVGSISPWVETLCLAVGAASVTTVEVIVCRTHITPYASCHDCMLTSFCYSYVISVQPLDLWRRRGT